MGIAREHLFHIPIGRRMIALENLMRLNLIIPALESYYLERATGSVRLKTLWDELDATEINERFESIKRIITQLARDPEWSLSKVEKEVDDPNRWLAEIRYHLSDLGHALMAMCDPPISEGKHNER
jgi:hypothetical protein